jgi:mono/diheme cytochrome c family protein
MRLKRTLIVLICTLFLLGLAFAAVAWHPVITAIEPPEKAAFDKALVAKGAQLALIANCNTCHTNPDFSPYAGGRPLPTPFGTIHSTNITPDPDTGIGRWSEAAFLRAMHEGVGRDGRHLYPAFPYDHFTKLSPEDIGAIYAFLMTREPVRAETPRNNLSFPFTMRPLIAGWKVLFFRPERFQPDVARSAQWSRGAYLVEGLAHCGACHTPRNAVGAEKRDQSLAGGEAEGWHAPALNAASPAPVRWTDEQLFTYLRRGFVDPHGVAAGPMRSVPDNLGEVAEQDVKAVAAYVGSTLVAATAGRPAHPDELMAKRREMEPAMRAQDSPDTTGRRADGAVSDAATIYTGACAPCHESSGRSFSAHGIHLAQSKVVAMPAPRNLIHVILNGIEPPVGTPNALMPGFGAVFTNEQIATLAAFLRARFSDQPAWSGVQDQVRKLRRQENSS